MLNSQLSMLDKQFTKLAEAFSSVVNRTGNPHPVDAGALAVLPLRKRLSYHSDTLAQALTI